MFSVSKPTSGAIYIVKLDDIINDENTQLYFRNLFCSYLHAYCHVPSFMYMNISLRFRHTS
jgi:hypothetical protein